VAILSGTRPPVPRACPHCGSERQIEPLQGGGYLCLACAKVFGEPPKPPPAA
jgi:DNA-directed RNA polymerase subunit RPC12/RpoP